MTIQEIEEKFKAILDDAHQYSVLYEKEKDKFPYRLNVIKELHDDENAHSRILIRLLQYKEKGEYTWLNFFVNRMNELCGGDVNIEISNPSIDTEHSTGDGRIDGLVLEEGKYAIVIENKIWNAVDQNEQIDKYVRFAKEQCKVPPENIFVIYLTKNGGKVVADYSLTSETRKELGNHYIPMSFQDNILPWLDEDVLPNCKVKEKCLATAVYQYIDYLKGICGLLDYQKIASKSALKQILNEMNIEETYTEIRKKHQEVQNLANILGNEINELGKHIAGEFQRLTGMCFSEKPMFEFKDNNQMLRSNFYQIFDERWEKIEYLYPHLEWYPVSCSNLFESKELTLVLHIEGDWKTKNWSVRNRCVEIFLQKAKENKVEYLKRYDDNTYFKKSYAIPNEQTFAALNENEQYKYLHDIYFSKEIQQIIELMNDTIAEMKQQ